MRLSSKSILLLELAGAAFAIPAKRSASRPVADHSRAHDVKEAFEMSWNAYYEHAFPHDTLHPVTNGYEDDR
jgi:mannosyl-oligosaccharide alpha-1,2-mannosidase